VSLPAVVMAAGLGTRLRPLTDVVAKPVLPLDGSPVVATLLRELAAAGTREATVVVGHLGAQVAAVVGDGSAFHLDVRVVRQSSQDGSADAVRVAGLEPPYLVLAADTAFRPGDIGRFAESFAAGDVAGAIAVRRHEAKDAIAVEGERIVRVVDRGGPGPWTGAPLWAVGAAVHERLCLDEAPYELGNAFQLAIDDGYEVAAVAIGATRDLTRPLDLLRENFPYLRTVT
jgi:UDP-N-acetylglucosamine diphosphorylase / glucose-1-phosphate thymidylyltransferase / UDP-N-acetylgalactosamine diphosphorylase / glucosamine-1-phosphate N-acetyltransferase / galactosamine-1-phosphate N-acetyltransferase